MTATDPTSALLRAALALDAGAPSAATLQDVQALHRDAEAEGERRLAACRDANDVEHALHAGMLGIELSLASRALESACDWQSRGNAGAARVNAAIARRQLLRAATAVNKPRVHTTSLGPDAPVIELPPDTPLPAAGEGAPAEAVAVAAQRNIAAYHREHERYYTTFQTERALDLYREGNKLKILAGVWLEPPGPDRQPPVDYARSEYHPVGSVDLNSRHAIGSIGVLYMEGPGETEPGEFVGMKNQLRGLAGASMRLGKWLTDKMHGAWRREQSVFGEGAPELGAARFVSISTNWLGARSMYLSGRVLSLGLALLARQDLSREGVRRDRAAAARIVLNAGWIVTMAGQVQAQSGLELSESDRSWTAFLEGLPPDAR